MTKAKIPELSSLIKTKKLDWVNPNIKDNLFEIPNEICNDFKLYHFDRNISSEDVIKEITKDGFRPANSWELLLWPSWNDNNWVIALGSVARVDGVRGAPFLSGDGSGRGLYLGWFGSGWGASCRFLAVRNSPSESSSLGSGSLDTLNLDAAIKIVKEAGYQVSKIL